MRKLSVRTEQFTDSVIRRMTRISDQYGAINLSQGFPDFGPPQMLKKSLKEAADRDVHQYSITWGAKNTRDALAQKQEHFTGMKINPEEEIVLTCGSTEAMMAAMMTVVNPGDKAVIFSPFYENYGADAILSGAEPVYVPLVPPEYRFEPEALENAFRQGACVLVLCNPSNPSGKVFTREELETIADIVKRYDAYVITDEVYEHIVYDPYEHIYIAALPGMRERTICCGSLSKTYSITGWRLGYTIAPPQITDRIRKVHDFLTVGAAAPLQEAVLPGLLADDSYYAELKNVYTGKRELFLSGLRDIGLPYTVPQGAYYVMVDVSKYGVTDDLAFCEWLAQEIGVGAVPGSSFFKEPVNDYIRLHFAKNDEVLYAALERLQKLTKVNVPKL